MTLKIKNRSNLISSFLSPISKVSDRCVIHIDEHNLSCLASTPDGTLILYTKFKHNSKLEGGECNLNICDINKIIRIFSYIDEEDMDLNINENSLSYKDDNIQFNYFLLEDGVINSPAVSVDKLRKLEYQTSFELTHDSMNNVNKLASYANDSEKVYFYTDSGYVKGELNDRKRQNINNASIRISDKYKGDEIEKPLPIKYENFRIISTSQNGSINTLINKKLSVLLFQTSDEQSNTAYFMSGLVA